eukprot:GHVN01010466.1.p1 GENE.GHVN01010466.1~~GHVN01010466.1.p1  ORF type:complete len:130 (-),score=7.59 GHVN01010466.1:302-691(-)
MSQIHAVRSIKGVQPSTTEKLGPPLQVLRAMFRGHFRESNEFQIEIPGIRPKILDNFIQFIKTDECDLLTTRGIGAADNQRRQTSTEVDDILELFKLGDSYDVKVLKWKTQLDLPSASHRLLLMFPWLL